MQLLNIILKNESKYDLYNKEIGGLNYWIYGRELFHTKVDAIKNDLGVVHREKKSLKNRITEAFKLIYYAYFYPNRNKKNVEVLFINHTRRIQRYDYYECLYTSMLVPFFDNYMMYERRGSHSHCRPVKEEVFYGDKVSIQANLIAVIHKFFKTIQYRDIKKCISNDVSAAISSILDEYEVNKKYTDYFVEILTYNYFIYKYKQNYFEKFLKRVNPRVIVETVSYSADCMALNEAAKKMKIPTIELQHGVMNPEHIAYNYGDYKEILQFPEYIFVFSKYWKDVTAAPICKSNIIATGYPYFERGIKEAYDSVGTNEKKGICFISQGDNGSRISQLAVELSKVLNLEEWNVFYKLHPGEFAEWEKAYPWLLNTGIIVVGETGMSLYEVFARCQYQVGVSSTALYEGLGFGLKTFVYHIHKSEFFEDLCKMGYAFYVEDVYDLQQRMINTDNLGMQGNTFWEKDSLDCIITEIYRIMNKNLN